MGNAFVYMFSDKTFGIKFFCIFLIVLVTLLIGNFSNNNPIMISGIIAGICGIITLGHFIECINSVKISIDKVYLPFISIKTLWVGIKASIGALLLNTITGIISIFTLYIPAITIALFSPALLSIFSDDYKIKSYFAFDKCFCIIKNDFWKYFITLLALIFYTTFITTGMFLLFNKLGIKPEDLLTSGNITLNIFTVAIFTAFVYAYNLYVFAFWIGDLYKLHRYDTEEEYFRH